MRPGWVEGDERLNSLGARSQREIPYERDPDTARIVLVGYDMKVGPGGEEHWFGQHRDRAGKAVPTAATTIAKWAAAFETMLPQLAALGVEVLNAGPDSAVTRFTVRPRQEAAGNVLGSFRDNGP